MVQGAQQPNHATQMYVQPLVVRTSGILPPETLSIVCTLGAVLGGWLINSFTARHAAFVSDRWGVLVTKETAIALQANCD